MAYQEYEITVVFRVAAESQDDANRKQVKLRDYITRAVQSLTSISAPTRKAP